VYFPIWFLCALPDDGVKSLAGREVVMPVLKAVSFAVCVLVLLVAGALVGKGMSLLRRSSQELLDE
jgi:hypothetical protein